MIGTFAYLIFNTTRNRLLSQFRRLRTPRYAIGFVLGVAYFWFFLGRNLARSSAGPAGVASGSALETLAPAFVLLVVAGIWIFGGDMSALAFTEAEVSLLFTAPVSRRALVTYKLARSQLLIMVNTFIWVVILRRGSTALPGVLSAAAVWVVFTTLNLHRMGAALTRASQVEYRAAGSKRRWLARVFGIVIVTTMVVAFVLAPLGDVLAPRSDNPFAFVHGIVLFFESPPMRTILSPFRLVTAPAFTQTPAAWAAAFLPAFGIVLLHAWWVLRSDAAFEEAAALASAEQARRLEAMRSRKTTTFQAATGSGYKTIALAATGAPPVAILWKNAIAFRRTVKIASLLRVPIMAFVIAAGFGWRSGDALGWLAGTAALMAVVVPLFGIQVLRNDLRSDMLHLPFLKSLPVAGADLVLAEVASGVVPMAVVQLVLAVVAATAAMLGTAVVPIPANVVIGLLVALPFTLLALDGAICTIINGSAVLFPAWIRLGPSGPGGVEMMGQMMLSMIASFLVFTVMLVIPVAFGGAAWYALRSSAAVAVTAGCLLGAVALAAESYAMILALGHAFDRVEPQAVT